MADEAKREIELTDDLLDYVRRCTLKLASRYCPPGIEPDDVVQEVLLYLVSKPPEFDPSKGASVKTLLYLIVQRQIWRYVEQWGQTVGRERFLETGDLELRPRDAERPASMPFLDYIVCDETREMCRLLIVHDGNCSEVARRMNVAEGTVRYRIKHLAPKLIAAGFDPFDMKELMRERRD